MVQAHAGADLYEVAAFLGPVQTDQAGAELCVVPLQILHRGRPVDEFDQMRSKFYGDKAKPVSFVIKRLLHDDSGMVGIHGTAGYSWSGGSPSGPS